MEQLFSRFQIGEKVKISTYWKGLPPRSLNSSEIYTIKSCKFVGTSPVKGGTSSSYRVTLEENDFDGCASWFMPANKAAEVLYE